MLLQYIHIIFLHHDAIYFVKCTSPSCSKDMMLPPPCFTVGMVGMVFFGLQASPFSLQTIIIIMAKQFYFCFIRPENISPKSTCPHVQLQIVVWLFYGCFGAVASSLLSGLSDYVDIGLVLLRIEILLNLFPPASFAVVLGLIRTSRTKVRSSLGERKFLLPELYDGCVVPWCLYLRTIVCTDEHGTFRLEPDLWRSTIYLLNLG